MYDTVISRAVRMQTHNSQGDTSANIMTKRFSSANTYKDG